MKKRLGILALISVQILSGINTPLIKQAVEKMSPLAFGFLRCFISLAIMLPIYLLLRRRNAHKKKKIVNLKDTLLVGLGTFLVYGVSNLAFYAGIKQTTSINASIILLLWPIVFFLANVEVLKERFSTRTFAGIGLAFGGALIAVGAPLAGGFTLASITTPGTVLIFGCVVIDVVGTLLLKKSLKHVDPLTVQVTGLVVATLFYSILAAPHVSELSLLSDPVVRNAILYGSLMVGCLAYNLGYYALRVIKGGDYSVISYLQPIVGIISATILLHEGFTPSLVLGAIAVFIGLYLVEARHIGHPHGHGVHH